MLSLLFTHFPSRYKGKTASSTIPQKEIAGPRDSGRFSKTTAMAASQIHTMPKNLRPHPHSVQGGI